MTQDSIKARFEIPWRQVLQENGTLASSLPDNISPDECVALYKMMVRNRIFDKKAIALQRTGKLGTYPSTYGAEAIAAGMGAAMTPEDVLCPYYREVGAQLWRGVKMEEILLYWGGDERGSAFENCPHDFPICVPIASQCLYGAGAAFALKSEGKGRAVVVGIGDGGTSRGDFYEALNVAGLWQLPIVFVINNNGWAISVPTDCQTGAQTLAQKALAGGIDGLQIDGNDVIGVAAEMKKALEKARSGGGPSVIEMMSYRMGDHTTADDASRYRSHEELKSNEAKDPIARMRYYLEQAKQWSQDDETILTTNLQAEVEAAVERYVNTPPQAPESAFEHLYEELPLAYVDQWETLKGRSNA